MSKLTTLLLILYIMLIPIAYSGCVGYFQDKYKSNIWENRGVCTMISTVPLVSFFMSGFYHRGFKL